MIRRRSRVYVPPPLTQRGERIREESRGAVLDLRPYEAPPNLRLPGGRRAYCRRCVRHWLNGAWYWDLPIIGPGGMWRCVLCCGLAADEAECECCGLPREVNAALIAKGRWT